MNDNEIIKSIVQGDRDSFRILVERYQQMVFRTCMGFLHNKEDAEDLTQDVFIQAYQSLSRFKGESAFSTWLYRIAVNASLNKIRKSKLKLVFERFENLTGSDRTGSDTYPVIKNDEDPEKIIIRQEHSEWLGRALDSLPENQKTAIVLSKYDDLSQKEIAEIMNTTEGAVEALLQRAKKNLREKLLFHKKLTKPSVGKIRILFLTI
ncbi:MAG TPA: RNA polymerase sigma factor [Bacteroidales bacterium]|jgi:RNA polymerase sigma-70 factor (ECF subfamily)|nr:RNA polymerase sigma factor [Bacteroidales bacterium]HOX73984.1 RNA polymerase sigma factor [Bacteroidales bacterium]HPM87707.1 RNA polymerase sigma factor [Bacteroidales bacterium]HQM69974.1 RNA polymerase sigma factor [Bacteroidales bacterium]